MRCVTIIIFASLILTSACNGPDPPEVGTSTPEVSTRPDGPQPPSEPVFVSGTVPYCWEQPLYAEPADVQILFDASGSMAGFRAVQPRLVEWLKRAVSSLNGSMLELEGYRLAQFAEGSGIFNEAGWNAAAAAYSPRGNTNLHDAVATAADYDLTFIVTDGVAATGVGGSGDCPGGVDAACVARSLRRVIHAPSEGGDTERGLWVVPLVADYDGPFYTEELLNPNQFDSGATIEAVEAEVGSGVSVVAPRADAQGRLSFNYRGPRAALLIVLANSPSLGRTAVSRIIENAPYTGVEAADGFGRTSASLGVMPPIEVYPGFLRDIDWVGFDRVDDPAAASGTMDARAEVGDGAAITLECLGAEPAWALYDLEGEPTTASGAGCTDFVVLPATRLDFRVAGSDDRESFRSALPHYELRDSTAFADMRLRLSCPASLSGDGVAAQWVAFMEYEPAARCLSGSGCDEPAFRSVHALSTARPSEQPHRIYGLAPLLESFYRDVANDRRSDALARLSIRSPE